ncbi:helicase [Chytriomyces hyalinus]|nr:helicase [Chytriomyces hyalinus]
MKRTSQTASQTASARSNRSSDVIAGTENSHARAFSVLIRKKQSFNKKHKNWDDDGILAVEASSAASLFSAAGKMIASNTAFSISKDPSDETIYSFGGREIQISSEITWESYSSGKCFLGTSEPIHLQTVRPPVTLTKTTAASRANMQSTSKIGGMGKFRPPSFIGSSGSAPKAVAIPPAKPRHDPSAEGAIVFKRPVKEAKDSRQIVDVVVDPHDFNSQVLGNLRPHQIQGVQFLYECVMGMNDYGGRGAILADEMGLGKTLQAITLLWTLLKQSSFSNTPPPVKRALIVCPASLCNNWKREFGKWLGDERTRVFVMEDSSDITDFTVGKVYSVLICGYEKLRSIKQTLPSSIFDLIIADEGHRLKNASTQAYQILNSFDAKRRVILSGTPIQNDLGEFHALCDWVNSGVLGSRNVFAEVYEAVILKGRDTSASSEERLFGEERSAELSRITQQFILRRTSAIFTESSNGRTHLPPKTEFTIFIRLGKIQEQLYEYLIAHPHVKRVYGGSGDGRNVLGYITLLKKLVNSATLINNDDTVTAVDLGVTKYFESQIAQLDPPSLFDMSSKMRILDSMLKRIHETSTEKVVIISNWTQTLDVVQELLRTQNMSFLRLDGQTDSSKRQGLVDQFNTSNSQTNFCFLLSAKAGGLGLNLIGASRLFLLDIDWNPSVCLQAMARVWREGQKRPVKIYRFLSTGSIEERIFQRQISKLGLSDTLMDASQQSFSAAKFTKEELKDLFTYSKNTDCLSIQIAKEEVRESVMSGFEAFPFNDENRDASVANLALKDEILGGVMQSGDGGVQDLVSYCMERVTNN